MMPGGIIMTLCEDIKQELCKIAKKHGLKKLILFGSRATDTCWERSDIDLAASFSSAKQYFNFQEDVEEIETLLMFDIVDLASGLINLELLEDIRREGIVLYDEENKGEKV